MFYCAAIFFIIAIVLGILGPIVVGIFALGGIAATASKAVADVVIGLFVLGLSLFVLFMLLGCIATLVRNRTNGLVWWPGGQW